MKRDDKPRREPKAPRDRRGKKAKEGELVQATGEDFEQRGMGVAPKE